MTLAHFIDEAGFLAVLFVLLAALAVTVLRLVALPLAAAAYALDHLADAATRALPASAPRTGGGTR